MNGLNYERMWLSLRHKAAQEEGMGADQAGEAVFGPCLSLIRSMEENRLFPRETEEAEKVEHEAVDGKAPPPLPPVYAMYPDFRLMWFTLAHTAEAKPTVYPGLRVWMEEIEDEEIAEAVDPMAKWADKLVELYKATKSEKSGGKKVPGVSGFTESAAFRLSRIASELIDLARAIGE